MSAPTSPASTLLKANGDVLTAADGSVVDVDTLTMIPMEIVWVPGRPEPKLGMNGLPRKSRGSALGPNHESADEGEWRYRLPEWTGPGTPTWAHLGAPGSIYRGPTLSPSALETNSECDAKWGFDRLDEREKPPNRPAEMGTERHAELNRWLVHGTMPTTPGMSTLIRHFPMPGECESEVACAYVFGRPGHEVVLAGYIDARQMPAKSSNSFAATGNFSTETGNLSTKSSLLSLYLKQEWTVCNNPPMHPIIRDLKTTGDFRWKKTAAQLRQHIQPNIYALDAMLRTGHDVCLLKWTYGQIKEPGHLKRVETVNENGSSKNASECEGVLLTRRQAIATVARYVVQYGERMVEEMRAVEAVAADAKSRGVSLRVLYDGDFDEPKEGIEFIESFAQKMDKDADSCNLYGGCAWKKTGICNMPKGAGGFKSWLSADRAKRGLGKSEEAETVSVAVVSKLGNRFGTREKQVEIPKVKERVMSALGNRFGATKPTVASTTTSAPVKAATPAVPAPVKAATTPTTALGSRFGAKPTTTTTTARPVTGSVTARVKAPTPAPVETETPEISKVDVKAVADGSASGAAVSAAGVDEAGLIQRLKGLATQGVVNGNTAAIAAAILGAPTHSITSTGVAGRTITMAKDGEANSLGALAVGINPPDVADEWTDEEQDKEAEAIANGKGSATIPGGIAGLPAVSATAATAAAAAAALAQEAANQKAAKEAEKSAKLEAKDAEKRAKLEAKEAERKAKAEAKKNGTPTQGEFRTVNADAVRERLAGLSTGKPNLDWLIQGRPCSIQDAIFVLDEVTLRLIESKQRIAGARVAEAVAALEALDVATPSAATAPVNE